MNYFYILKCKDGTLYCGSAKDLKDREEKHNSGKGSKYVLSRGGGKIVYHEKFRSWGKTLKREVEVKKWSRNKKLMLTKKNMKIIICGSITASKEILDIKARLETFDNEVEIPEGVKNEFLRGRTEVSTEEKADDKIKSDLIRGYYEKIKSYDAVLVVNVEKRGIKNYIGGNTFLEMAFAHVLNKKLYCLNPLPELSYTAELAAMQPVILTGDLNKI